MPSKLKGGAEMITSIKRNMSYNIYLGIEAYLQSRIACCRPSKISKVASIWKEVDRGCMFEDECSMRIWSLDEDFSAWLFNILPELYYFVRVLHHCCHLQLQLSLFKWSDHFCDELECRRQDSHFYYYRVLWLLLVEQDNRLTVLKWIYP
jgi:hypothetical protein